MRFICIILVSIFVSFNFSNAQAADKFKVATTFSIIADMARNVAQDAADVVAITKTGAEIHNYAPTPRDILRAQNADLILWNGLNLELWFEKFFQNLQHIPSVEVSAGVEIIDINGGAYSGKPNPHAWMSLRAALIYIDNIRDAFIRYDQSNAEHYRQNAAIYKTQIKNTLAPFKAAFAALPQSRRWLVTSEGAFSYFARDFGLKEIFLWPINADQQGTPQQVRHVIDTMRKHKIPAIFSESTISAEPAKQVAREVPTAYGGVLYVDSLSQSNGIVPTYLDLLRVTAQTILNGLNGS